MCNHGEPRGARYCALCKRDGMSAKIDAITQVSEHADGTWWAASMRAINHLAKTRDTFTADDVLELVEAQGYRTKENRAMGGVMRHAQTKGLIEITDVFEPSHNKRKHASPTRVWRSLIVPAQMEFCPRSIRQLCRCLGVHHQVCGMRKRCPTSSKAIPLRFL